MLPKSTGYLGKRSMTKEKLVEALKIYERSEGNWSSNARYCVAMVPRALKFVEEGRIEKAMRWLGFIQGVMWSEGIYTIDEMKEHNV